MKTKLLLMSLFAAILAQAQSPINSFYVDPSDTFALVIEGAPIDQSVTGPSQVWNFNQLISIGDSSYDTTAPTTEEISTYPTTNNVILSTVNANLLTSTSQLFVKDINDQISITGLLNSGLELNFSTDNATLGTFPLNYGYSNTDDLAGNYIFGTNAGTLTGEIVTSVDAYGTLTTNVGSVNNLAVTRLKTLITINLNFGFFTNIGTITQTTYSYYTSSRLAFRTSTTVSLVPLAGIDQTDSTIESFNGSLNVESNTLQSNQLQVVPNPVGDHMNLVANEGVNILSILIVDANGRSVLNPNINEKTIDVKQLQKGIYMAKIVTDKGTITKKIIKE